MAEAKSQRVAEVINWWLQEEIISSDVGSNAILSEYSDRRADLYKDFDDPTNVMAAKAISHNNRFTFFAENLNDTSSWLDDHGASKFIFAALMAVSGGWRKQCIIEAVSAEDYTYRRHNLGPTGIDVMSAVTAELDGVKLTDFTYDEIVGNAITKTLGAKDRIIELDQRIYNGAIDSHESALVVAMQETQQIGISLAVAHIAVAATLRGGDYEKVPILEPKTITEAAVIYPFIEQAS